MAREPLWYFNGDWVPMSRVLISPDDRGFNGDTVFDSFRTFGGEIFRLDEHINRLYRSLKYMQFEIAETPERMKQICQEGMRLNSDASGNGEFGFYPMVTRGPGGRTRDAHSPNVIVKVNGNASNGRFAPLYETGVHGVIVRTKSYPAGSLDPKVKHHSRNNFALADLEAAAVDPEGYPILTDYDGCLTEGISYNVFLVTDGVVRTPTDRHILQGVTRGVVLELAERLGIPSREEDLQPYDLYTADEAFIASTSPCVVPMTSVDRRAVGDGRPGPVVQQLLAGFGEMLGVDPVDLARRDAARESAES